LLAFVLAVLGSWVRINEAGMACPDWPLCHGELVPTFAGGVIWEWLHRLVALTEGVAVLGLIVTGWRVRARIAAVLPALAALGIIFVVQVGVGAVTVFLGNVPVSVVVHWAVAMCLLAVLTTLAVLAVAAPPAGSLSAKAGASSTTVALAGAAFFAFVTMCIGAYVSSSHAGLACTTFPACDGTAFGRSAAQFAQMLHRFAAGVFLIVAAGATWYGTRAGSPPVRAFSLVGLALAILQVILGVGNVVWLMPLPLREAHAANAGATFLAYVIATLLSAIEQLGRTDVAGLPQSANGRRILRADR
jgi:heme A synthase